MPKLKMIGVTIGILLLLTVAVSAAPTTIYFVTYGVIEGWNELFDVFEEANPDIEVSVQVFPYSEYAEKVSVMVASGAAPDVVQTVAQNKAQWAELGIISDVTGLWQKSPTLQNTQFFPVMYDAITYKNRYWGVPYDFGAQIYYHDVDSMAEKGINPPDDNWTVEDLKQLAQKLTDETKRVYGTNFVITGGEGFHIQWLYNWSGHDWLDESRTKVLLNEPASLDMLKYWYEIQNDLHLAPGWPGAWKARGNFYTGGYGMWQGWISYAATNADQFVYDWKTTLMPKAPYGQQSFAHGHMFSITKQSRQTEAAWRLIEWLGSYEGQKAATLIRNRAPSGPYMDLWNAYFRPLGSEKSNEMIKWVVNTLYGQGYARNFTYWVSFPEMNAVVKTHLGNIFKKQMPIGNEMQAAQEELEAILEAL